MDRDASPAPIMRAYSWRQVAALVHLSRTHVMTLERQGKFPRRIKTGERRVVWMESEVLDWLATRARPG